MTDVEPEAPSVLPFAVQGHCASNCCDQYPTLHVHGDEAEYNGWRLAVTPEQTALARIEQIAKAFDISMGGQETFNALAPPRVKQIRDIAREALNR